MNVDPFPSPGLLAITDPPCSSTRFFTIANPRPSPLWLRVRVGSDWLKRSKTCGRNRALIPFPVSLIDNSTCELARSSTICTFPPLGVNLIALVSRFHTTCCIRLGSPVTGPAIGSTTTSTRTPFECAASCTDSTARAITAGISTR